MLEKIVLIAILIVAAIYLIYSLFFNKKKDCGCGDCGGCSTDKDEQQKK